MAPAARRVAYVTCLSDLLKYQIVNVIATSIATGEVRPSGREQRGDVVEHLIAASIGESRLQTQTANTI